MPAALFTQQTIVKTSVIVPSNVLAWVLCCLWIHKEGLATHTGVALVWRFRAKNMQTVTNDQSCENSLTTAEGKLCLPSLVAVPHHILGLKARRAKCSLRHVIKKLNEKNIMPASAISDVKSSGRTFKSKELLISERLSSILKQKQSPLYFAANDLSIIVCSQTQITFTKSELLYRLITSKFHFYLSVESFDWLE